MTEGSCERCARTGHPCLPAPPSRQGKRPKREGSQLITDSQPAADKEEMVRRLLEKMQRDWGANNSCAHFVQGFFAPGNPNPQAIKWLLHHWMGLATARNSYGLLDGTIRLAAMCDVAVSDLVVGSQSSIRPTGLPPPDPVVHCVDSLPGYGYARSANPRSDGSVDLYVNAAFREHVCAVERLHGCWEANENEMLSLFIHPDDIHVLPQETGKFLAQVVGELLETPEVGALTHATQRIVRARVDGEYVRCHGKIKACSIDGCIYFGFFLLPLEADELALQPAGQLGPLTSSEECAASLLKLTDVHAYADSTAPYVPLLPLTTTPPVEFSECDPIDPDMTDPLFATLNFQIDDVFAW